MTGYARIDFRVRADGTPFVLEANANPNLEREEDFADAALHDGIPYPALLGRLISLGRGYRAEWRERLARRGQTAPANVLTSGDGRASRGLPACHWRLFAGFRIQWFSSGKNTKRLSMPRRCSAVNVARPWV